MRCGARDSQEARRGTHKKRPSRMFITIQRVYRVGRIDLGLLRIKWHCRRSREGFRACKARDSCPSSHWPPASKRAGCKYVHSFPASFRVRSVQARPESRWRDQDSAGERPSRPGTEIYADSYGYPNASYPWDSRASKCPVQTLAAPGVPPELAPLSMFINRDSHHFMNKMVTVPI